MTTKPWDASGEARRALHGIVSDPQYGAAALSQPAVMTNLLKDMLPDEPREAGLLVAAAQANLAGSLRGYVTQGLDAGTAVSLTATSFVNSTSHTRDASDWVVNELALALGLKAPSQFDQPTAPPAPSAPTVAVPVAQPYQPVPPSYQPVAQPYQPTPQPYQPAAPGPWQASPWTVPPKPASTGGSMAAGVCGLIGALLVLIACFVPFYDYIGSPGAGLLLGRRGSPVSETFWFASEPIGVLLVAIVVGIRLLSSGSRPSAKATLHGMLIAFGIQTMLLFAGYAFVVYSPAKHEAGGFIGILGGLALLIGGLVGRARGDQAQSAAPAQASAAVGPGPAGS